jgi:hypothetical protein
MERGKGTSQSAEVPSGNAKLSTKDSTPIPIPASYLAVDQREVLDLAKQIKI